MFPNLREVLDISEVKNALDTCKSEALSLVIWKNESNTRLKQNSILIDYFHNNINTLAMLSFEDTSFIIKNEIIYLYQSDLKFLFKGIVVKIDKTSITLRLESKLFLEEKRINKRFIFKQVIFTAELEIHNTQKELNKKFIAQINNVSKAGYCFSVTAGRGSLFGIDTKINFTKLDKVLFPVPILGVVRHITPQKDDFGQTQLRVGVKFIKESELFNDVFEELSSMY